MLIVNEKNAMSLLFSKPNTESIKHLMNTVCGEADWQIKSMDAGLTSLAWEATDKHQSFVVRAMPIDSLKPMTYPSEMAILKQLFEREHLVPEPLAHSTSHSIAEIKFSWAITRKMDGVPVGYEYFSPQVAAQFGKLLADCHAIPTDGGWGWVQVDNDKFTAKQTTAQHGACERWNKFPLYPLDGSNLENHIVRRFFPKYLRSLEAITPYLMEAASTGQPVICHSDLHGGHIFVKDAELAGVIDFGDACILPAAWDFAILAFYYGWDTLDIVLDNYTDDPAERKALLYQTYHIGIILDLNKMKKAFDHYPKRFAKSVQRSFFLQCRTLIQKHQLENLK